MTKRTSFDQRLRAMTDADLDKLRDQAKLLSDDEQELLSLELKRRHDASQEERERRNEEWHREREEQKRLEKERERLEQEKQRELTRRAHKASFEELASWSDSTTSADELIAIRTEVARRRRASKQRNQKGVEAMMRLNTSSEETLLGWDTAGATVEELGAVAKELRRRLARLAPLKRKLEAIQSAQRFRRRGDYDVPTVTDLPPLKLEKK